MAAARGAAFAAAVGMVDRVHNHAAHFGAAPQPAAASSLTAADVDVVAVADTGIHALGWSRAQAVDYLTDLGFPASQAAAEVDRYVVWPGQAPSYLIGMLEILRLRTEVESALGSDFDLAAFHHAILRHGPVPVEVLDQVVAHYIDTAS